MAELRVRQMGVEDLDVRIRYFQDATDEHLQLIGVDRSRLGLLEAWRQSFTEDLTRPVVERTDYGLMWEADGDPIGFSTADRIVFGDRAYMHLHVFRAENRGKGYGTELVRATARTYVGLFELERLYCEPHAFNTAANRTLQSAGFTYVSTQWTTPTPLNVEQVTTSGCSSHPASCSSGSLPMAAGGVQDVPERTWLRRSDGSVACPLGLAAPLSQGDVAWRSRIAMVDETQDRGPEFDGVRIGRPATGALIDAGYEKLRDLPDGLDSLLELHGVGPAAVRRLQAARSRD